MSQIDYKEKYLKYKTKYLELKQRGGSKKLTFNQIKNKFEEMKKNNKILYYIRWDAPIKREKDEKGEKLQIIEISEEKGKNNKYLSIRCKDVSGKNINGGKEFSYSVSNTNMFNFKYIEATYNLEIKKIGDDYFLTHCSSDDCAGIVN